MESEFDLKQVLMVGPDYVGHRGGIGAVIEAYHAYFNDLYFIPTYRAFENNGKKVFYFIKQFFMINNHLRTNKKIKIVHIHGSRKASFFRKLLIFLLAKKIYKKKIIYHIHSGAYDKFYEKSNFLVRKMIRYFIEDVEILFCLSQHWKEYFSKTFHCKNILIINNVIVQKGKASLQIDPSQSILMSFFGRIGDNKGIFDLLDLFGDEREKYLGKVKLFIGGDGEIEKLLQLIEKLKLEEIISYVGWATGKLKNEIFSNSHIYILPSYSEGLPVSILEAMSYGLPIISTPVGSIPEVVEDKRNGFLIQPGNKSEIRVAIDSFIENPLLIEEYGRESLKIVQPYFIENVAKELIGCYKSLLQKN